MFSTIVKRVSDNPVLFLFCRGLLERDFVAVRALIRRELSLGQGRRTLDLGCGPGGFADLFNGDPYVGADLNPRYIAHAQRHRKGTFLVADARSIALPDASFDQVLVFGLLHHLPDADARLVLGEIRRLLVKNGRALLIEDIPATSRLNLMGHLIHMAENGEHIRPVEDYRRLYREVAPIGRDEVLRSGICDYYAAVLVT